MYRNAYRDFMAQLDAIGQLANSSGAFRGAPDAPAAISRVRGPLQRWAGARRQIEIWCSWQSIRARGSHGVSGKYFQAKPGALVV